MMIAVIHGGSFLPDEAVKIFLTLKTAFLILHLTKKKFLSIQYFSVATEFHSWRKKMRKLLCSALVVIIGLLPSVSMAAMQTQAEKLKSSATPQAINQATVPIISVSVVEPKSGQPPYVPGWPLPIKWTYGGTPPGLAKIVLLKGTQEVFTFTPGTSWGSGGQGSFAAAMPANEFGFNLYKVKVVSTTNSAWTATSGEFVSMPVIKVQSPVNDGQTWKVGETHTITWKYSGGCGNTVGIKAILTSDQWAYDLKTNWPIGSNWNGSFPWTIPASIPAGEYRVYLQGDKTCNDRTAKFTLVH